MEYQKEKNDIYLAKWLNDEMSDDALKKIVSKSDFETYIKIRKGLDYFESPKFDKDRVYRKISSHFTKNERKVIQLKWFYAAAVIIALVVSGYFYKISLSINTYSNFGEQKHITLNDGSEAILNANSTISYLKKWKDKRELSLVGEAFFKVKKGKSFTVNTQNGSVTVLGTQFNINSQDNFFLVKCFEGKVRVIQNNDTIYLTKGKAYQYNNIGKQQWDFISEKPIWLNGASSFKSTQLKVVILSLENQFGIKIDTGNIDTNQIFTGSFSHDNLKIALKSVFLPMDISFQLENKKVFLNKK